MKKLPQVAVIEDKPEIIEQVEFFLDRSGYEVAATASNMSEALALIQNIGEGALKCDVIVLDANLSAQRNCGMDAKIITDEIRRHKIGAYVLGFSGSAMADYAHDIKVDADVRKKPHNIVQTIDELLSA